jgi:Arc/MetJ-type ribon-helix-helix transcriptional regulator
VSGDNDINFKTSIALIPHWVERMDELKQKKKFPSRSAIINAALAEFFGHLDEREAAKITENDLDIGQLFEEFIKSEQGRKAIEKSKLKKKG